MWRTKCGVPARRDRRRLGHSRSVCNGDGDAIRASREGSLGTGLSLALRRFRGCAASADDACRPGQRPGAVWTRLGAPPSREPTEAWGTSRSAHQRSSQGGRLPSGGETPQSGPRTTHWLQDHRRLHIQHIQHAQCSCSCPKSGRYPCRSCPFSLLALFFPAV